MDAFKLIPLVQLLSDTGAPYDFTFNNVPFTYEDLSTPAGLAEIATYAEGIGPSKRQIVPAETVDLDGDGNPDDLNGDGYFSDADKVLGEPTSLVDDAHTAGLLVYPYTFRSDEEFLASDYEGNPELEYEQFIQLGVDGYFSDFPETGKKVRAQIVADEVRSPQNRGVLAGEAVDNLPSSGGFEGMAYSPDRQTLYPLLEKRVVGDPENALRIYEFDLEKQSFAEELVGFYGLENPSYAIGDFTPINEREFLVLERDGKQGEEAEFKKIFKIDITGVDGNGFVAKEEVADLLNIQDPNDLNGDGSTTFDFPFEAIEDLLVLDENTILVANDNNYPFSMGREGDIDNNEIILLQLDEPLNLAAGIGLPAFSNL